MKYLIIGHRPAGGSPSELGSNTDMQAAIAKAKEFAGYLEAYAKITVEADGPGGTRKTWFSVPCAAAQGVPGPKPQPVRSSLKPHENPYTRDLLPPALREQPKMSDSNGTASKPEPAPKPAPPVDLSSPAVRHPMPDEQVRTNRLAELKAANERLASRKQQPRSEPAPAAATAPAPSQVKGQAARGEFMKRVLKEIGTGCTRAQMDERLAEVSQPPSNYDSFWRVYRMVFGQSPPPAQNPHGRPNKQAKAAPASPKTQATVSPKPPRPAANPTPPAAVRPQDLPGADLEQLIAFGQALKPWGGSEGARRLLDKIDQFMEAIA